MLKKSRFGESDQIITLLKEDGSQLRIVAKGSRKPKNRSSAYLELFNVVDMLCAAGKSLDIVTESHLVESHSKIAVDPLKAAASSCVTELLAKVTEPSLPYENLYAMSCTALNAIDGADPDVVPVMLAAFILKAVSLIGFKPVLDSCVICRTSLGTSSDHNKDVRFSLTEGGVICKDCSSFADVSWVPSQVIKMCEKLLRTRFSDMASITCDEGTVFEVLQLCSQWLMSHLGIKLKSMPFFIDICFIRT